MEDMDLNVPINLDSSISNTSYFAGINANRAIGRGQIVKRVKGVLPRYSNIRSDVVLTSEEVSLNPQPTVISESLPSEPLTPTPTPTFPVFTLPAPTATSQSSPSPSPNILLTAQSANLPQPASTTQTPTSTPTQTPTGGGGGGYGGGGTGGGGGSTATATDDKSAEKLGTGGEDKECDSNYWILGLALGAIGGYLYAKNKNKELLKTALIISAVGGIAGFVVDKIICKDKAVTVIPPVTDKKTEGTATKSNAVGKQLTGKTVINQPSEVKLACTKQGEEVCSRKSSAGVIEVKCCNSRGELTPNEPVVVT